MFGQNGKFKCLSILLLVLSTSGCGYHLQATDRPMGGLQIDSLSIPLMASPSSSLGFEGYFTKVIRREFLSQSKIPFASKDKAAAVLDDALASLDRQTELARQDGRVIQEPSWAGDVRAMSERLKNRDGV